MRVALTCFASYLLHPFMSQICVCSSFVFVLFQESKHLFTICSFSALRNIKNKASSAKKKNKDSTVKASCGKEAGTGRSWHLLAHLSSHLAFHLSFHLASRHARHVVSPLSDCPHLGSKLCGTCQTNPSW